MAKEPWGSIGPLTNAAVAQARPDSGQSKIEEEWMGSLKHEGDFLLFWGGAFRTTWRTQGREQPFGITWHSLLFSSDEASPGRQVLQTPAEHVELMLSSLAHEGRIRLLQALFSGPKTTAELTAATGLRGGNLHYHLKELLYAHYAELREGSYRLTERGAQMLITVTCLARLCVEDQGERGLVVSGWRRGTAEA